MSRNWLALLGGLAIALTAASAGAADSPTVSPKATPAPATSATPAPTPTATPAPPYPKSPVGFVKGYTWGWNSSRGDYLTPAAAESMKALAATGTQWITLAYDAHMPAWNKPEILWGNNDPTMVSEDEIRHAIQMARELKLKIILKPVVDLAAGAPNGKWRGTIEFTTAAGQTDEQAWETWWNNYEAYLLRHAKIAQATGCEMLCVGCELETTERFEARWRGLIKKVREVYKGPVVYNATFGTIWKVAWWDAVDIVGISAYWWLDTKADSSLEQMMKSWQPILAGMRHLSLKVKRPIFFIEIGCRSARGGSSMPGDFSHWEWPYDGDEQARYYEAALRTFWDEPWFCGYTWWDWKVKLETPAAAAVNKEFYAYGKPAEKVLRQWYAKERQ